MQDYLDLIVKLVIGSYLLTAMAISTGAWAFHYLYKLIRNHHEHRLRELEREVFGEDWDD